MNLYSILSILGITLEIIVLGLSIICGLCNIILFEPYISGVGCGELSKFPIIIYASGILIIIYFPLLYYEILKRFRTNNIIMNILVIIGYMIIFILEAITLNYIYNDDNLEGRCYQSDLIYGKFQGFYIIASPWIILGLVILNQFFET